MKIGYADLFHPAAPVSNATFLVGRDQELHELNALLHHKAEHPVIVGSRGIGKTSMLKVISSNYSDVGRVNCTRHSTFDDIAKSILHSLGFDVMVSESVQKTGKEIRGSWSIPAIIEAGGNANIERERKRLEIGQIEVDEHLLFRILVGMNKPIIITIDEYDLVQDSATKIRTADFIKMISDVEEAQKIRIIFAGVAKSKQALIGAHPSITRQTHEIFLRPLKPGDFIRYMTMAENRLGIKINDSVKREISLICLGQPYYMHLLCIEAIEAMKKRDSSSRTLTFDDFERSKERAASKAYTDQLKQFGPALRKVKANQFAFNALKMLCEQNKAEIPSPELFRYAEKTKFQALNDLKSGLELLQAERIIYIFKDSRVISFSDPLLKPFLMLRFKELRQPHRYDSLQPSLFQSNEDEGVPPDDSADQVELDN